MRGEYAGKLQPKNLLPGAAPGVGVQADPVEVLAGLYAGTGGRSDAASTGVLTLEQLTIQQHDTATTALTVQSAGSGFGSSLTVWKDSTGATVFSVNSVGIPQLFSFMQLAEIASPGTPAANVARLYGVDRAGVSWVAFKDDGGTEHLLNVPAAADLPVHGASVHTDVTRSLWVPRSALTLDTGTAVTAGTAPDATDTANLADGSTQGVYFTLLVPADFSSGLSLVPYWLPVATDAVAHTVRWSVDYQVAAAGTDMTAAGTTAAWTGASAARTANQLVLDTAQSLTGGAANNVLRINLRRIGADAADTYVGDVGLIGVRLDYTATG